MRLIDADEMAIQESEAYLRANTRGDINPITLGLNRVVHRKIQELIAKTPTIDAAPVVRCKECEFRYTADCALDCAAYETTDETFCAYGKRKEGAADGQERI